MTPMNEVCGNNEEAGKAPEKADVVKPVGPSGYQKPQLVTWSAEELEKTGTSLNACVSF